MYQQKELLSALTELPDKEKLEQLKEKYSALVLFQIAKRCVKDELINTEAVSFHLDATGEKFLVYKNNKPALTEKGTDLLKE